MLHFFELPCLPSWGFPASLSPGGRLFKLVFDKLCAGVAMLARFWLRVGQKLGAISAPPVGKVPENNSILGPGFPAIGDFGQGVFHCFVLVFIVFRAFWLWPCWGCKPKIVKFRIKTLFVGCFGGSGGRFQKDWLAYLGVSSPKSNPFGSLWPLPDPIWKPFVAKNLPGLDFLVVFSTTSIVY